MLEVELPAERIQRSVDRSARHLAQRTRIPGFRPGKVPRAMLERSLGVNRDDPNAPNPLYDDAKEHLFEESMVEALRETDLDVLTVPEPEWLRFSEIAGAAYRVTVPIRPDVRLGDYRDFPFGIEIDEVDDAKVDAVVEQLRDQYATLAPVEGRPAQKGDYAVVGFEGRRGGEPFEGGAAERYPLILGSERMIPGFEDEIVGMSEGDEKTFSITFPVDYPETSLAGEQVEFTVRLRELRQKQLPDVDNEFARTLGAYDDLGMLREEIRRRLQAGARDRARHAFADRIIEYAAGNAELEIPELLVEREIEVMHDELRARLAEQGIGYDEYLRVRFGAEDAEQAPKPQAAMTTADARARIVLPDGRRANELPSAAETPPAASGPPAWERKLHEEYRAPAEHRVKVLLTVSAIAEKEGIEVSDEEVEAEIARARERYADSPNLLRYFESPRGRSYVRSTLRRSKTVETLVDRWLEQHPEIGPVPHLHGDEQPASLPDAAISEENETSAAVPAADPVPEASAR